MRSVSKSASGPILSAPKDVACLKTFTLWKKKLGPVPEPLVLQEIPETQIAKARSTKHRVDA